MDLMKEFLNCERFVVEEGDDTFSFDVGAVVGNCFVGINRGFNSRSFHLSEDALPCSSKPKGQKNNGSQNQ